MQKAEDPLEALLLEALQGEERPLIQSGWQAIRQEAVRQMKKFKKTRN